MNNKTQENNNNLSETKNKVGRPPKYEEYHPYLIYAIYRQHPNIQEKQICEILGVSISIYHKWQNDFPEFLEAVTKGRKWIAARIEGAAYKEVLGYYYTDEVTSKDGIVQLQKYARPNAPLLMMLLKSMCGLKENDIEQNNENTEFDVNNLNNEEKKLFFKLIEKTKKHEK